MNVFLLDPPRRLLSAFVWIASSNTIGEYQDQDFQISSISWRHYD